jgi:hypothetical protein
MDIAAAILHCRPGALWSCGDTYESLVWLDTEQPKPTLAELETAYAEAVALAAQAHTKTGQVTLRQIRHWLIENGHYATVTGYINGIPDPVTRLKAQTDFQHCSSVERSHPLVGTIGAILGLTQAQVDAAFTEASKL